MCLFQVSAGLSDLVDLSHGFCRVKRIGAEHRLEQDLLLLDVGLEVDELKAALLKDVVHLFRLFGREGKTLDDHGILPPHAGRRDVEVCVHGTSSRRADASTVTEVAGAIVSTLHHATLHRAVAHTLPHARTDLGGRPLALDGCGRGGWSS